MNSPGLITVTAPDRLPTARDAIADAVQRLLRAMDTDDDEDTVTRTLQGLVDRLLDAAPALSTDLLERRLLGLAGALEELGARAEPDALIDCAILRADRLH